MAILNEDADSYQKFVNQAGTVLKPLEVLPPMGGEEFGLHLLRTIGLLNQKAKDSFVSVPTTLTNRMDIPYGFTFGLLMNKTGISEDKVQEMQIQLEDIKMLSSVLFDSRVQKIIDFKRNRVTIEDKKNPQDPRYLDERLKYTNNISVVRPYRVKFQCMSDGIASTLLGLLLKRHLFPFGEWRSRLRGQQLVKMGILEWVMEKCMEEKWMEVQWQMTVVRLGAEVLECNSLEGL